MNILKKLSVFLIPFLLFACKKDDGEQAKIDKAIIQKYIADSSLVADSTASGLYYVIEEEGSGANPNINSYIYIKYKGYLTNGFIFDQTVGDTYDNFLYKLIKGWQEGIPLIKKGGKIKLLIPSALGYGDQAAGDDIPANSVLIFDVELVNFQ